MKQLKTALLVLLMVLLLEIPTHAANSYSVATGATVAINEFGTCRRVKNNNSKALFVPTKTTAEWTAFRNGTGHGATITNCVMTCGTMTASTQCGSNRTAGNTIETTAQASIAACKTRCQTLSNVDVCEFDNQFGYCAAFGTCTIGSAAATIYAAKCSLQ